MQNSSKSESYNVINVVHIASGDLWAGAEVQLYYLAREQLKNKNLNVKVILLNHGLLDERLRKNDVDVVVFDEIKLNGLQIILKILGLLKDFKPDIVHTHRMKENVLGSLASLLVAKAQSIRTLHGVQEFSLKPWQIHKHAFRLLDKFCGRFIQKKIVLVSHELGESSRREFPEEKLQVIENGITVDDLQRDSDAPIKLPGPSDTIRIAFAGRLVPVKRVDLFLQAASLLIQENPNDYSFYILGEGPLLHEMQALSNQLDINQHVFFMGFQRDLLAHLSRMHLLLITSDHEGLPMNLLEALLLEVPVIAHGVGGINRVLGESKYGTIIHAHNAEAYAAAIRAYRDDPGTARRIAHEGRAMVEARYSTARSASSYYRLYTHLCGQ